MKLRKSALGALAAVALASTSLAIGATAAGAEPVTKVTICHRTNSDTNPYVEITPDVFGVLDGHDKKHDEPFVWGPTLKASHQKWGDIIPAFDYIDKKGDLQHFPGLNLDTLGGVDGKTSGGDILENDCAIPDAPPPVETFGSLEVKKTVEGTPSGTPTPTDFTLHVKCDDDSIDEDVVFPLTGGTKTYDELVTGISCTVTEPGAGTFSPGTVVKFNGSVVDPTVGVDVEIPDDSTVTVTVDNDFSAVAGEVVTDPGTTTPAPAVAPAVVAAPAFTG